MGRDRRPPGSRSPWEGIGRGDRRDRRPPRLDPGASTVTVSEAAGGSKAAQAISDGIEAAWKDLMSRPFMTDGTDFTVRIGADPVRGGGGVEIPPHPRPDAARERLEAEERALRGPVQRYLLAAAPGIAWDDVVGNETARAHLVEAIEHPVRHAELYRHYGKAPTKGVLLYGPPGCGKTLFGKAAASVLAQLHGAKAAAFLSVKGPELQSMWVGQTEERIRAIFAYARAYRALHGHPLVVFIDEADAILPSRDGGAAWFQASIVATFLTEMDGIAESGALVILATNRPEAIDAAILRDGRIDRKIKVERPDRAAAEAILAKALAGVPVSAPQPEPVAPDTVRASLAARAAAAVFADGQVVAELDTEAGPHALRLSDIVNGAMLVGLIEQAKGHAFRRDLAAGGVPGGIGWADIEAAIAAVLAQNRGLSHDAAIRELGARVGFARARVQTGPTPRAPRYALDAAGAVVRVA